MTESDDANPWMSAAPVARAPVDSSGAATALQALLARLAADGCDGERVYESLRRRLTVFFRLHVPVEAEALADTVLDRMARKIVEGTQIEHVPSFALGVARMILKESLARQSRAQRTAERLQQSQEPPSTPADTHEAEAEATQLEQRVQTLRTCLAHFGSSARHLILTYYAGEGVERITVRQRLADELGLSLNTLRNRALRLRARLEHCLIHASHANTTQGLQQRDEFVSRDTSEVTPDQI